MDKTVGFALVGAGVIAPTHARALREIPDARLVAVVDKNPAAGEPFARQWGADYHQDLDQALARPDVQVVTICTPSGTHGPLGQQAAGAGKHVLVEKPIEVSVERADELITTCRQAGVLLSGVFQQRFLDGRKLAELVTSGQLGKPLYLTASIKWYRTQEYYSHSEWHGTWAMDGGGVLINQAIHTLDLLRWVGGEVESVQGMVTTVGHDMEAEDLALATIKFASGAWGTVEASTALFPGLPERLEVHGTEGTAILAGGKLTLVHLRGQEPQQPAGAPGWSGAASPAVDDITGHRRQLENMVGAVLGREPLVVPGESARDTLALVKAIYRSAQEQRPVRPAPSLAGR